MASRGGVAMGTRARKRSSLLPSGTGAFLRQRSLQLLGIGLIIVASALLLAFITYDPADPSWNRAAAGASTNLLGVPGAILADLLLQTIGLSGLLIGLVLGGWGWRLLRDQRLPRFWWRLALLFATLGLASLSLAPLARPTSWPIAASLGGASGELMLGHLAGATALDPQLLAAGAGVLALFGLLYCLGLTGREWLVMGDALRRGTIGLTGGFRTLFRLPGRLGQLVQRRRARVDAVEDEDEADEAIPVRRTRKAKASATRREPVMAAARKAQAPTGLVAKRKKARNSKKAKEADQGRLDFGPMGDYELPPLNLLEKPAASQQDSALSRDALEKNARLLESVLEDFGVKGEIVKVRPGPVVTRYELEPAPGIKTSRVVGLADDIARSMSTIAVRVAVVPGSSTIGIELPNARRERVLLRELLGSETFDRAGGKLPLTLGKDISGAPIIVDLSRMPHLLIAGTTGSGKSVSINVLILSLLYRLGPDRCKLILIDPKMLELSVYEGIPHLLAPVVTEPKKAVVALKWTVREMEERYRKMSRLGVRNVEGYNARIEEAQRSGEVLTRRVQTGFDPDTGLPITEEQPFDLEPLPFIVVVVDEMADLMLVAGKDIEAAVQRLAQMARAAGIHIIMATQRPSVDVITGTIKANFPTRISFHVTSKIDSRTILGEMGAEQLLGQGDMLYMAHGGQITRVHGPFVTDQEVEDIVTFLKRQGQPAYIEAVTEDEEDGFDPLEAGGGNSGDELYDKAVAVVCQHGKASTSFVQRHLQIGYNRAARIIEKMEEQGVVSPANHVGKREILVQGHGDI
ncbi:MAG: DNA translocase FtsK 4TM domain-containing protein [Pseudomonadota bacterium]